MFSVYSPNSLGEILLATVMDYLEVGQVAEAIDVAKQGFSRLRKL